MVGRYFYSHVHHNIGYLVQNIETRKCSQWMNEWRKYEIYLCLYLCICLCIYVSSMYLCIYLSIHPQQTISHKKGNSDIDAINGGLIRLQWQLYPFLKSYMCLLKEYFTSKLYLSSHSFSLSHDSGARGHSSCLRHDVVSVPPWLWEVG